MKTDGRETLLFLDKNRMFVYDGNGILKLEIPTNIIRDLDIIDKNGLDVLIDTFIKSKKLDPTRVWLILSDTVCFSKDFTQTNSAKLESEIKDFLEAVPFDQIVSKRYKAQTGIRVISTNYELLEAIGEIFERNEFSLEGIVPSAIFPGFNTKKILDLDFARYVFDSRNLMRQGNLLQKVETSNVSTEKVLEPAKKNRALPYLLAGFGLLLAILLSVLFLRK